MQGSQRRPHALRRWLAWLLPGLLVACGGQSCTSCSGPQPVVQTPDELLLPTATHVRVTQHGFDVVAQNLVSLLKALLGAGPNGVAVLDVAQLLGPQPLQFSGGLGIFQGKATLRDLILTLDLQALKIQLVEGSQPARIRVAFDHAKIGIVQGVVAGQTSVAGITSDAACHVHNGLGGTHLATMSGQLDLVLGVDAQGKLAVKAEVQQPMLHEVGFSLSKDCGLSECSDKVLLEPACLECELCATGKLASDATSALKNLLGPLLDQALELLGNLLIQQVLSKNLNGKPLDLELPLDLRGLLQQAAPPLAAISGEPAGTLRLRGRPSPQAFRVVQGALEARLDAGVFAKSHPCVSATGSDTATWFAQLPRVPAPALPLSMVKVAANGQVTNQAVDVGVLLATPVIEEAVWATLRSGLLCAQVDSAQLHALSGGQLLLTAGTLDLAMPGAAQLAGSMAALRIAVHPSARPQDGPRVLLSDEVTATALTLQLPDFTMAIEAQVRGRWLTLAELQTDVKAVASIGVAGDKLQLEVRNVSVSQLTVVGEALAPAANWQALVPAVTQLALSLLLAQPLQFDVDLQQAIQQVLALPLQAELIGVRASGGGDWLLVGIGLGNASPKGGP